MSFESLNERRMMRDQLKVLPDTIGIYLFRGEDDEVLYIGKALSLKKRVSSYFKASKNQPPKIQSLMRLVTSFEFIVTESEHRALLLESSLIKEHEPRFNVRLKDHKTFPYIKVTINEEFPRIYVTRNIKEDGGQYFGPFTDVKAARKSVRLLRGVFPIRSHCQLNGRLCLDYHIGKCSGACGGKISNEEYNKLVDQMVHFLDGQGDDLLQDLEAQMNQTSQDLDYERAAVLRDRINILKTILERQNVTTPFIRDQDIIGLTKTDHRACAQIFFRRDGRIIGGHQLYLEGISDEPDNELMGTVIKQYYTGSTYIPSTVILQYSPPEKESILEWLSEKRDDSVSFIIPTSGNNHDLIKMAEKNAKLALKHHELKLQKEYEMTVGALEELQKALNLAKAPKRIEAFDISNIMGTSATGSMVVFENGKPKNSDYRHYKIQSIKKPDDVGMMAELLKRRYKKSTPQAEQKGKSPLPNLILVDGGKGQLNAAVKVLNENNLQIPIIGLAKRFENIYVPGQSDPEVLPKDSNALYLLQRIRDEAHRFAIRLHHSIRAEQTGKSVLDEIVGIGNKRKRTLLQYFESINRIREATMEELTQVPGIDQKIARAILLHFQNIK